MTHRGVDSLQTNEKGPTLATWAAECCYAAPQVLEFDMSGRLLDSWGGPGDGYQWPQNPSGIAVDSKGNVWIAAAGAPVAAGARGARGAAAAAAPAAATAACAAAAPGSDGWTDCCKGSPRSAAAATADTAAGRGGAAAVPAVPAANAAGAAQGARGARGGGAAAAPGDAHVIKFTSGGNFLLQIGTPGQSDGPDSTTTLSRPVIACDRRSGKRTVRRRYRQPPHCRLRCDNGHAQAPLVRIRRQGSRAPLRRPTIRLRRPCDRSATSRA